MRILYVDIETAPEYKEFKDMPLDGQAAFAKKFQKRVDSGEKPNLETIYGEEAALYAEFSKVICIGLGSVMLPDPNVTGSTEYIFLKAMIGTEANILAEFCRIIGKVKPDVICAHNGKNFDFPFMGRRLLINGMELPSILNVGDKKPWEVQWRDTVTAWQFSDFKYYVSLITLAYIFKIPNPKQTLSGGEVPAAFYAGRIMDIANYCLDDVFALVNIDRRISNMPTIDVIQKDIKTYDAA